VPIELGAEFIHESAPELTRSNDGLIVFVLVVPTQKRRQRGLIRLSRTGRYE
jgi:hypothetical protein